MGIVIVFCIFIYDLVENKRAWQIWIEDICFSCCCSLLFFSRNTTEFNQVSAAGWEWKNALSRVAIVNCNIPKYRNLLQVNDNYK